MAVAYRLVLGVWIGAMLFFVVAVAPAAFQVLPTRHLAGELVNAVLARLNLFGIVAGPALIAVARGFDEPRGYLRAGLLAGMSIGHAVSHWLLAPKLAALRAAMGRPIDEVAKTDPLRIAFGQWHGVSSALMLAVLLLGLLAFALAPATRGAAIR